MGVDDIDGVVNGLTRLVSQTTVDCDRIGYFAALYRQVTVEIRKAIQAGQFDDGARMSRLDAAFGNRYFDALASWRRQEACSGCWREAFGLTQDPDTIVVQHLLLGANAHINLDLTVAAAQTCPGDSILNMQRDFLLINGILAQVLLQVQKTLGEVSPYLWLLDEFGGRTEDRILDFSMREARAEAWQNAIVLAHQTDVDRASTIARLDVHATVLARLVSRPDGLVRPAIELIRAGENQDISAVITKLDGAMDSSG